MEKYKRNPNTQCYSCGKEIYKRPNEIAKGKIYCSVDCMWKSRGRTPKTTCQECGELTKPTHKDRPRKFCSRACANRARRGISYSKSSRGSASRRRLAEIQNTFEIDSCMITGCPYDKVLDVHRYIPANKGGKYEIGNMFAICPNHHAEITRGLLKVEKISDKELRPTSR